MLTVNEIFYSIQGESTYAGKPCVFVRLAGCDLRCSWCDTPYAFNEGEKMSIDAVLQQVDQYGSPLVEVTGGEPLLQDDVYPLMQRLVDSGRTVLLETGGQIDISRVPGAVVSYIKNGEVERHVSERISAAVRVECVRRYGRGGTPTVKEGSIDEGIHPRSLRERRSRAGWRHARSGTAGG